jgi:O-antigen/teichoic acid export membrane protein
LRFKNNEALWALIDQAAVSGGNFLTALVLARSLNRTDYGTFSLLFLVLFSLNTLHSSLVIYPLTVAVAKSDDRAAREVLGRCVFHTGVLWLGWSALLVVALVVLHLPSLLTSTALAMLFWQLQEVARRSLIANADGRKAILPDLISYVGQAGLLWAVHSQSLNVIFFCICGTSAAALFWQLMMARPLFRNLLEPMHIEHAWRLGKYTLIANVLNMGILQIPSWTVDALLGRATVGVFQALANLIGVANPILFSMSNILIPEIARAASNGPTAARKVMVKNGIIFGSLLLPCFALLILVPRQLMSVAYGIHSPYLEMAPLLRVMAITFLLQFLATLIGAYEGGLSRPRTYMFVQICGLVVSVVGGIVLIKMYGIAGAVYAGALTAAARMSVFALLSQRSDRNQAALLKAEAADFRPGKALSALCDE